MATTKYPLAKLRDLTGLTYSAIGTALGMTAGRVRHAAIGVYPAIRPAAAIRAERLSRWRISAEEFRFGRLRSRRRKAS